MGALGEDWIALSGVPSSCALSGVVCDELVSSSNSSKLLTPRSTIACVGGRSATFWLVSPAIAYSPGGGPGVNGFLEPACVVPGVRGSNAGALTGTEGDGASLPNVNAPSENL